MPTDAADSKLVIGPPDLRPLGRSKVRRLETATERALRLAELQEPPCEIWRRSKRLLNREPLPLGHADRSTPQKATASGRVSDRARDEHQR